MIRMLFATLYMTIALLFAFQVKSEIMNPVFLVPTLIVLALAAWHVVRVIRSVRTEKAVKSETAEA